MNDFIIAMVILGAFWFGFFLGCWVGVLSKGDEYGTGT